jgi:hypothetical protein
VLKHFDAAARMGKMTSSGVMFGLRWRNVGGMGYARSVAVADNGLDLIGRNNFCAVLLRFARRILRSRDDIVMTWTDSFRGAHHRGQVPLLPSFRCTRVRRAAETVSPSNETEISCGGRWSAWPAGKAFLINSKVNCRASRR